MKRREPRFNIAWRIEIDEKGNELNQMDKEYQIAYVDEPEWGTIGRGIRDFNIQQAGNDNYQNLCYVLSTAD